MLPGYFEKEYGADIFDGLGLLCVEKEEISLPKKREKRYLLTIISASLGESFYKRNEKIS